MAREINSYSRLVTQMGLSEDLPENFIRAVQFFTFLDLVCDGAEIEGFATPSANGLPIPTSLLGPSRANDVATLTPDEQRYIELAQRDIFLNGKAIRNESGDETIVNTSLALRVGADNQQIMTGIDTLRRSETLTPAVVKNNGNMEANKVTGTVQAGLTKDDTPTHIIITLSWSSIRQLHPFDGSSQGLHITEGEFKNKPDTDLLSGLIFPQVRLLNKSGNQLFVKNLDRIGAISVGPYARDYQFQIPASAIRDDTAISDNFPLEVQVLRRDQELRANATLGRNPFADLKVGRKTERKNVYEEGSRRFTEFTFSRLQSLIPANPTTATFPKSAYIGLRYSAEQFPNIPQRQFRIRGIKVKLPQGTNDGTVPVDSVNGRLLYPTGYSFVDLNNDVTKKRWTTDPAWILYALLTQDYGLNISESKIDKASFFIASQYCSTPVTGESTPRYSFNGVINQRKKAIDLIRQVAALMRATVYYKNGSIKIALDKLESTTSYLFTNANVVDGKFSYSGIDKDKKYTQVNVTYFNNDIQELDQVSVSSDQISPAFEDKYGVNQTNIQALFTTDRSQAIRLGRTILYTNLLESEIITFQCGLEAASILEPFMIIKVADRLKETFRASGRIKSVTSPTVLVVDDSTSTTVGVVGDNFLVIDKNGGLQERTIDAVSGSTVTLSSALSPEPQAGTIWAVKTGNIQHRKFRVTNIKQTTNFTFNITAIVYDDDKYSYIDTLDLGNGIGRDPTTLLDRLPAPPIFNISEELVRVNGKSTSRLIVDFGYVDGAKKYQLSYKQSGNGPFVIYQFTNQFIINNNPAGFYEFSLKSISASELPSLDASEATFVASGTVRPIANVQNLRAIESGKDLILRFDPSEDQDVLNFGLVRVKYHTSTDGSGTYVNAEFEKDVDGSSTEIIINNYQNGEYLVKFIDSVENESDSATSVVVNKLVASDDKTVSIREESTFSGNKTNMVKSTSLNALVLTTGTTFDALTDFNNLTTATETFATLDLLTGGISSTGDYTFNANDIDLGAAFRFEVDTHIKKSGFNTVTLWDDYTDLINTWPESNFTGSGETGDSGTVTFKVAKSQTGTASTSFETFTNTEMTARTLSFKIDVLNDSGYKNIAIAELGVNFVFKARTERSIDNSSATNGVLTSSGSGATTVSFAKKFFTGTTAVGGSTSAFNPVVFININNMQSGDFFTIDSVSSSQFVVSIKNGSGFVARNFTYSAFGYGSG
jgi:hypothetical protein